MNIYDDILPSQVDSDFEDDGEELLVQSQVLPDVVRTVNHEDVLMDASLQKFQDQMMRTDSQESHPFLMNEPLSKIQKPSSLYCDVSQPKSFMMSQQQSLHTQSMTFDGEESELLEMPKTSSGMSSFQRLYS